MVRLLRFILYLIIALLVLGFALLNAQSVKLNYYFGQLELPLSLMLATVASLGALLGVVASIGMAIKARRQLSVLRKNIDVAEREVAKLRALSLMPSLKDKQ